MNLLKAKKLFFIIFLFIPFITKAQNENRTISMQEKNISLREVFAKIEKQTGYSIAYDHSELNLNKKNHLIGKGREY